MPYAVQEWLQNTVALIATLHDMADWKYCDSEKAGIKTVLAYLADQGTPDPICHAVEYVLTRIGFKESLKKSSRLCSSAVADDQTSMDRQSASQHVEGKDSKCLIAPERGDVAEPNKCPAGEAAHVSTSDQKCQGIESDVFLAGNPETTEELVLRIVQDADRLDALGVTSLNCIASGCLFHRLPLLFVQCGSSYETHFHDTIRNHRNGGLLNCPFTPVYLL